MKILKKELKYKNEKDNFSIPLNTLNEGINNFNNFFIYKENSKFKIFDRVCDHNGGKLLTNNVSKEIICPLHGWKLDPKTGSYLNIKLKKKQIDFKIDNNSINFNLENKFPVISNINKDFDIEVKFINHACLVIKTEFVKFAIDPWVLGPAFLGGWWLKKKSPTNSFEELNSCDFIFISHNHPDHLHDLTLQKINPKMKYIFPNFKNKSVENYLKSLGKKNLKSLDFGYEYQIENTNLKICPFKSGDFRDDSGLYFNIGNFSAILAVDSNSLNFLKLPSSVTLLASSFAGGASGFPVCFDNYQEQDKKKIVERNNKSLIIRNKQLISITSPKYYMPYAGFFEEKASRDKPIKKINKKITIKEYEKILSKNKTKILNLEEHQIFRFNGKKLINKETTEKFLKEILVEKYIDFQKKNFKKIDKKQIKSYFIKSNFNSNLKIFVSLTDDNFKKSYENFYVDFRKKNIEFNFFEKKEEASEEILKKK